MNSETVELLWVQLYDDYIQAIDGLDNGIFERQEKKLYRSERSITYRVGRLNPRWNQEVDDTGRSERFEAASQLVGGEWSTS